MIQPMPVLRAPIDQRIRYACWAAVIIFGASLFTQLWRGDPPVAWPILWDVGLVALLTYGLYRKNRVAAVGLPAYFVAGALWQLFGLHRGAPLGTLIILGFFLWRGAAAVFEYHGEQRAHASGPHAA